MRYFYVWVLIISSLDLTAGHLLGGEITWECVGNNQYVFKLNLYRECGSTMGVGISHTITSPAVPSGITVNRVYGKDLTLECIGPKSVNCDDVSPIYGPVELNYYESDPVTLPGNPPPSGWKFSFTGASGPTGANVSSQNGQYATEFFSTMYPGGSTGCNSSPAIPHSPVSQITPINKSYSLKVLKGHPDDSLYYDFANFPSIAGFYATGYSYDQPFPNNNTDPQNGQVSIHHSTGLVSVDAVNAFPSVYHYAIIVEQWRDNQLISEVVRRNHVLYDPDTSDNSVPDAFIDTLLFPLIHRQGAVYTLEADVTDTLDFEIQAWDNDSNIAMNRPQNISLHATGFALDTLWESNSNYINKAVIRPVSPQTGFNNPQSNKVQFYWPLQNEHLKAGGTNTHYFEFQFYDDQCMYVGLKTLTLKIRVKPASTVGLHNGLQANWHIFPNPASSEFTISGFEDVNTIELLDVNGKIIRSFLVKKNQQELKIEKVGLPAGLYFVKVHSGNTTSVRKVLFQ